MAELTITEQVYLKMKADIVCGKYEIVKDLPAILELCELFHVGRNTMRHALRLLEEDGLIKQEKGRNARVIFDLNKRENRAMYEEMLYGRLPSIAAVFDTMEYILPTIAQEAINRASDEDIAYLYHMADSLKDKQFHTSSELMNALMEIYSYAFSLLNNVYVSSLFTQMMDFILVAVPDYSLRKNEFQKNMAFIGNMLSVILKAILKKDSKVLKKTIKYLIHTISKKTQSYIQRIIDEEKTTFHPMPFYWYYEKEALYQNIIIDIFMDIHNGVYLKHKELPSLEQLAKKQNVSLRTSRKAIEVLNHYGIVKTVNGIGSYVNYDAFKKDDFLKNPEVKQNLKQFIDALSALQLCIKGFGPAFIKKISEDDLSKLIDVMEHQKRKIITPMVELLFQRNTCLSEIYRVLNKQLVWFMYLNYFYSFDNKENEYYAYYQLLLEHLKAHHMKKVYELLCEMMETSIHFVKQIYLS
ncbi:GntR family transcriptional regulator [Absiella sp. AM29-15]|uniref:GntR family transcriptional regulator n=1 Tax=Absiella sp. AM29-15 TaxID=2292278 RepID=UPI000E40A0C1|nr:GntR family transcriptional regulator [Absiella sp. AM29-15]RGC51980.1 GntR family transcriptional regulator [Absiella sp. AM29-15]